jgi:hypothetical protein
VTGETDKGREKAARRIDHASRMEASRARIVASRKLCVGTAVIIREARITINRTLEVLDIGLQSDPPGRLRRRTGDEDETAVDIR